MPWTVADVDKHKKDLTATQKRQWVHVANSELAKCKSKGGSDDSCAPMAIRAANGVTGNMIHINFRTDMGYTAVQVIHQGKPHLVVPVTMLVEGVHVGSHGPLLHVAEEFSRYPESWDGKPVTIQHPELNGVNVSANHPDIVDSTVVGRIYNARYENNALKAEAWLDEEKLQEISPDTLTALRASEPIEVSTGLFSDEVPEQGKWHGERYNAIARNYRPDHLALLPGGEGACSVDDGCGIRANKKKGGINVMTKNERFESMSDLKKEGWSITDILDNTSKGLIETLDALRKKVDSMDTSSSIHFLREAYDDYVIYEASSNQGSSKLYKQGYQTNSNGTIEFTGTPIEVRKKVEYEVINNGSFVRTKPTKTEVHTMTDLSKCPKCLEKVNALIANEASKFDETDRDWLLNQEEAVLDKLTPAVEKKTETKVVTVQKLTPDQEADLAFAAEARKKKRTVLKSGIQSNEDLKKIWTEEILNAMSEEGLERVFQTIKKEELPVDYSLNGGNNIQQNVVGSKVKPLLPTGMKKKVDTPVKS